MVRLKRARCPAFSANAFCALNRLAPELTPFGGTKKRIVTIAACPLFGCLVVLDKRFENVIVPPMSIAGLFSVPLRLEPSRLSPKPVARATVDIAKRSTLCRRRGIYAVRLHTGNRIEDVPCDAIIPIEEWNGALGDLAGLYSREQFIELFARIQCAH
jgi:hypothetical protein